MGVGKAALFAGTEIYNESLIRVLTSNHKSERNLSSVSPSFYCPPAGTGINIQGSLFWWRCSSSIKACFSILENYMKHWPTGLLLILPFSTRCDICLWLKTTCSQDWWNTELEDESISKMQFRGFRALLQIKQMKFKTQILDISTAQTTECSIMASFYLHEKVHNHRWKELASCPLIIPLLVIQGSNITNNHCSPTSSAAITD